MPPNRQRHSITPKSAARLRPVAADEDQAWLPRQFLEAEAGLESKRCRLQRLESGKQPGRVEPADGKCLIGLSSIHKGTQLPNVLTVRLSNVADVSKSVWVIPKP